MAAQILLIWIWFALHAKRLRDAGRGIDLPAAIALLYALSVALLVIVAVSFYVAFWPVPDRGIQGASALGLILFVSIIVALARLAALRFGLAGGGDLDG